MKIYNKKGRNETVSIKKKANNESIINLMTHRFYKVH
jgi:hypothetical protein